MKRIIALILTFAMMFTLVSVLASCDMQGEQGIQGEKGDKGDQGEQGIQGEKGDKGDQGEQGIQGEKGDKGDQGEQGIQGEKGDKGDQGEQGIQGEKGDKGDQGEQGIQGEKGDKGDQGEQGIQGEKGDKGDQGEQGIQGEKGDKGDQGEQGIQGEKGDKGDQGEQGIQGEKGDKGDQGEQGIQGEKGDKGDQGEQGIQGEKGDKGDQGEQGIQGEKGDKGDQGEQGIQGEKGDKGDQGEQGIQGEKGDKGDQGEQGIQGEKGDKGDQGEQGIQGEKGDKGDQGEQGIQGEKGDKGDTGATIEKIEFDEQGRLVITLTDGTVLDPIVLPEKDEHKHTYSEWLTIKGTTCTEDGIALRFCSECSYTETKILIRSGHSEETIYGYEATCTDSGLSDGTYCKVCGEIIVEQTYIPASGHSMIAEHHEEDASCTWYGYVSEEKCTKCNYRPAISKTAPLGHSLDENGTCMTCNHGVDEYWEMFMQDDGSDREFWIHGNFLEYNIEGYADTIMPSGSWNGKPISKYLNDATFDGCSWLISLTIPEYFTKLSEYFANGCENLRYVYIPSTMTYIYGDPFVRCNNLEIIHYGGTIDEWMYVSGMIVGEFRVDSENCTIYCSNGTINVMTGEITYYTE